MTYFECLVYDTAGNFIGRSIMGESKLQTTNIYSDDEVTDLNKRLHELNTSADLKKHWPHPRDPDVLRLLDNPAFHPLETHTVQVVDLENSPRIVYKLMARPQSEVDGGLTPEWVETDEIDEDASELAYKGVEVPRWPTDQVTRIKDACEIIARRRARMEQDA